MGKAVVSTPAGINGLHELVNGRDVIVAETGREMADAIARLLRQPAERQRLEQQARQTAEAVYSWDVIARRQREMYETLL